MIQTVLPRDLPGVKEFRIILEDIGTILVKVVVDETFNKDDEIII